MRHMGTLIFTGMANWSLVNIISVRSENHLNLIFCLFMSRHPWKVFVCLNFVFVFVLFVICLTKFFRWLLVWTRWTVPSTARSGSTFYILTKSSLGMSSLMCQVPDSTWLFVNHVIISICSISPPAMQPFLKYL